MYQICFIYREIGNILQIMEVEMSVNICWANKGLLNMKSAMPHNKHNGTSVWQDAESTHINETSDKGKNSFDINTRYGTNAECSTEKSNSEQNDIDKIMRVAADSILHGEYNNARNQLKIAMATDMENPEGYNLLGILYEQEGDMIKATRYYRVAYYMNQSFSAAAENLDRICQFGGKSRNDIKWGLKNTGGEIK